MNQEVRVLLQLTLDIDATLSKRDIENKLLSHLSIIGLPIRLIDIVEIREEAEIYGNEEL